MRNGIRARNNYLVATIMILTRVRLLCATFYERIEIEKFIESAERVVNTFKAARYLTDQSPDASRCA